MVITSIIISALALALSMWMGRRNPVKSSGLTAGMLILLMLAPLLLWMPKIHLNVDLPWIPTEMIASEAITISSADTQKTILDMMVITLSIYSLISMFLLMRLCSHYLITRRWCREASLCDNLVDVDLLENCAEQLKLKKLPELRFSEHVESPVITGLMKPVLLLPTNATEWSEETLKMVMLHELGHVQRRDLWTSLAGQIACALHWFNPLVWMLRKRLTHECEYACDAHVISSGAHPKNYINALCDVAEACCAYKLKNTTALGFSAALAMANQASLRNRVTNLLEGRPGVNRVNTMLVMLVLSVSASIAMAINLVRPDVTTLSNKVEGAEPVVAPVDDKEVNLRLNANPFPGDE